MQGDDFDRAKHAQQDDRDSRHVEPRLSWDAVRQVYQIAISGSVTKAASVLDVDRRTLSKSVTQLEEDLGQPIFLRLQNQWVLTEFGSTIVEQAEKAYSALSDIGRSVRLKDDQVSGRVTIRMTEGVGTFWLTPHLAEFQALHPNLLLDMQTQWTTSRVQELETDIAVQFQKPTASDVVCQRLGYLHLATFCSESYAKRFGVPKSFEDLKHHSLAFQQAEQLDESLVLQILGETKAERALAFKTDSSNLLLQLIRMGRAIGIVPTFTQILDVGVRHIPFDLYQALDIWLVFHPEAARRPAVRLTIDKIKSCFDAKRFPWFGKEYISPDRLLELDDTDWRINKVGFDPLAAL